MLGDREPLSLQEQYRLSIFSDDYILKNMEEPFRVPVESAFSTFFRPENAKFCYT